MADCTVPLVAVPNDPCAAVKYGTQIPQIFYQDMDGAAPDLTTLSGAQAGMNATGADKLFTLNHLAAGVVPAPTDQALSGNDVPRGGTQVTSRTRTMTARVQYPTAATHAAVSQHMERQKPVRVYLLDDKNFLQGPIEDATLTFGAFERAGLGQNIPANYPLTITYDSLVEAPIAATAAPFLKTLTNVA